MLALIAWIPAACAAANDEEAFAPDVVWKEPVQVASGEAHRGPWRMNESDFRFVDDPAVAMGRDGRIVVAWVDQAKQDVFFQQYGTDREPRFEAPVNVSNSPAVFSWLPRIVLGRRAPDEVYILWQEIVFSGGSHGGEIFFSRSANGGEDFSEPLNLSNTAAGAGKGRRSEHHWYNGSLDLAEGEQNELYAVWTEYEGALRFSRSSDGGRSFSAPMHIAGNDEEPARGPSLVVGGDGRIHIAWTVGEDGAADIRYTVSSDGGESFNDARIVAETDGYSDAPKLAVDSGGTLHLAFGEQQGGLFGTRAVYYTKLAEDGNFETPREVSSPLPDGGNGAGFPYLTLDREDRVYLAWELFPGRGDRPRGLGFLLSHDSGETFSTASVVPGSLNPEMGFNGSQQGFLMEKLAVSDNGSLAVVNSTFREDESSRIWLFIGKSPER